MTEVTKVDDAEIARRESYIRAYNRPRVLIDPFTWSYPCKSAAAMVTIGILAINLHNTLFKKPWNLHLLPRLGALGVIGACGYFLGTVREHHYRTRDAVLEHYQELHCDEFVNVDDRYGRPYADIILPWYPRRADNRKF
uniref:NADH dehydrogenase [ubiquinone] 1 subunit C2 n=1 Tax=Strongyloides venezuelensis TaxID=75913 RepID=A0A0K0EYE8_STRVS